MRSSAASLSPSNSRTLKRLHTREHSMGASPLVLQPREVLFSDYQPSAPTDSLFREACTHRAAGRFPEAIKTYEKLLAARPECWEAVLNLGVCYLKLGQTAKARRLYVQAGSATCEIRYNYALASLMLGKRYQALDALRECQKEAQGSLASDVVWALRKLKAEISSRSPLFEPSTDTEVEFSMVVRSSARDNTEKKQWWSLPGRARHQRLPSGGLFHSVEHYAPSPPVDVFPIFSPVPRLSLRKKRPKTSYRIPLRVCTGSSSEQSKVSLSCANQSSAVEGVSARSSVEKIRRHGSLVEEDLEDEQMIRKARVDMTVEKALHETAARIQSDLDHECDKQLLSESGEVPRGNKLRDEDIARVRREMAKEPSVRDLQLLAKLVSRLKFFEKFKPEVREELLSVGGHVTVPQDEFVFRQGDEGTQVYAVLRGAIIVWRHAMEYGAEPLIVHTLYDGDSFGELSLFIGDGGQKGRSAGCQAVTDTDLFFLPKEQYHRIMIREVEIGLQAKLSVLLKLPFFDGIHEFTLVPLAATLSPIRFKIGQYILQAGETPRGLHIIVSGRCNIYCEGYSLRPKDPHQSKSARCSPRSSAWSVTPGKKRGSVKDYVVTRAMMEASTALRKELIAFLKVEEVAPLFEKYTVVRERKLESVLAESSFFAGRCLVCASAASIEPCKYSIVADSAEVVVYVVTSAQVPLLGERLASQVLYVLSRVRDVDCPPDLARERIREEFSRWSSYKGKVIAGALRRNVG